MEFRKFAPIIRGEFSFEGESMEFFKSFKEMLNSCICIIHDLFESSSGFVQRILGYSNTIICSVKFYSSLLVKHNRTKTLKIFEIDIFCIL